METAIVKNKGGRPKGTVAKSTLLAMKMREMLTEELHKRFKPIVNAQLDAAMGIETEAFDRKSGRLYYKDLGPNPMAFRTIMEQAIGKPKESIEVKATVGVLLKLLE